MTEAKARNPDVKLYGLPWGFPGWVAEGGNFGLTNSTVHYVVKWLTGARTHYNLTIDYVGIWNEKQLGVRSRQYMLDLHAALRAANLSTIIIAVDDCCPPWGICPLLAADPEWLSVVGHVGNHYPGAYQPPACAALNVTKWSSEESIGDFTDGPHWSREINRNYQNGNITASIAWNLIAASAHTSAHSPHVDAHRSHLRGLYVCLTPCPAVMCGVRRYDDHLPVPRAGLMQANNPWSGAYEVDQDIWATAHTCQFTKPGWHYLGHGSGVGTLAGGGSFVSMTNGKDLTIIVEAMPNNAATDADIDLPHATQSVTFQLTGAFAQIPSLHVFHSNFNRSGGAPVWFRYEGTVQPVNGAFTFSIETSELYTFSTVNGTKGDHGPTPAPTTFPLPYADDFESYTPHKFANYLTDQAGSYEVVQSNNTAHGQTLRQMMPLMPVPWCRSDADLTYSVIGNHSWGAVQTSVDAMIERSGTAFLAVAVTTGGCLGEGRGGGGYGSSGVVLAVSTNQTWTVANRTDLTERLATGKVAVAAGQWVTLQIRATPAGMTFSVDGEVVATLANVTSRRTGWVAIGSSYDYVQFDNLRIQSSSVTEAVEEHRHVRAVEL